MPTPLSIGATLPHFELGDARGQTWTHRDLSSGEVIIYFYPQDETPGCTRQACALRDEHTRWTERGVRLFGVSPDDRDAHARFTDNHDLPFTLLSDVDHLLCEAFGIWGTQTWKGHTYEGVSRATFIFREGALVHRLLDVQVEGHWEQVWSAIDEGRAL